MQDVSFLVLDSIANCWKMTTSIIEDAGYKIVNDVVPSKVTVVMSGAYLNPFAISGKKILLTHPEEWNDLWFTLYEPVMKEYYDSIINIGAVKPEMLMDVIRGEIETI